jgi:cell division protein FtsN
MNTDSKQRKSPIRPFVVGLVLGVMGGMLGMRLYQSSQVDRQAPQTQPSAAVECPPAEQSPATAAHYPTRDAEDFNFYGVLEKVPVTPVRPDLEHPPMPPAQAPAPPAPTVAKGKPFYLQVASFKAEADADALRAKIVLAGGAAEVVAMDIPDKGTYFRVRVGPFADQEELGRTRQQLQEAGIDLQQALVMR